MQIRKAEIQEYHKVREFYYTLTDAMKDAEYGPGWKKDIYPSQEFLRGSIESGELYIGECDGKIIACMVLNHESNEGYQKVQWSVEANDSEVFVIHALGVHPAFSGKGVAKQMVRSVIELAQANQIKTIRLDVLKGNLPAEKAYTKIGFVCLDTIPMYYEDTGWTDYEVFEYIVSWLDPKEEQNDLYNR